MSINPFLSFTAMTNDVYCIWKCNNALFSTSFDSVDLFDALHNLDDAKEKKKKMEKIGHGLSISPVNRSNEDFLLIEAIAIVKYFHSQQGRLLQVDMHQFNAQYPEFENMNAHEKQELLEYHNVMTAATQIIPAKWNYNHLIDLTARICEGAKREDGSIVRYVTGSGAKESTKHRILIYERVGGVTKKKRPPRHFDVLMGILRQRSDPSNSKPLQHEPSDSSTSSAIAKAHMDVPIRESSYTACPVNNLVVNTQASQNELGLTIQTKSLSKTSLDRSPSDIIRSASITSTKAAELDNVPLFDYMHDDQSFTFLDTPSMQGFSLSQHSTYTPSGDTRHHISITENVLNDQTQDMNAEQHAHHATVFPPPIKSEGPSAGTSLSSSAPTSIPPSNAPLLAHASSVSSNVSSSSDGSESSTKNKRGKKRKAEAEVSDPALGKPPTRAEKERYDIIVSKLSNFSFQKEAGNKHFIKDVLQPKLKELDILVKHISDPKDGTNKLKSFATSLGVEPLSRFNDQFLIVEAAMILLLSSRQDRQYLVIDEDAFLKDFPEFTSSNEVATLLKYRNMMAAALEIIPAKWNSNHLLDVITRIVEGKEQKYITGGGATKQTKRRLDIYLKLGAIEKKVKFYNTALDYLNAGQPIIATESSSAAGDRGKSKSKSKKKKGKSSSSSSKGGGYGHDHHDEVLSQFQQAMDAPSLKLKVKEESYPHPSIPDITVNTKEYSDDLSLISCKATTVSREGTDAMSGAPYSFELARGVSISSTGGFEIFDNFDILADDDGGVNYSGNEEVTDMLHDCGVEGVQLHRSTSGNHEGVMRTISLTRHVSGEHALPDLHGNFIDVSSITRENSLQLRMPSL